MVKLFIAVMVINLAGTAGLYFAKADGWQPRSDSETFSRFVAWGEIALAAWGMWVLLHVY